jgi:cation diffusion facilitator family transporter
MSDGALTASFQHTHVFLGQGHEAKERRTWIVIALCSVMMIGEIIGGVLFGSIALVADGLHMSTHAGALLLTALAYTFARRYSEDQRFSFGTGKLGDLAGFTSAIILAAIAMLIGYEAFTRLVWPVAISYREAIPVAVVGLGVNVASVFLLSGAERHHGQSHGRESGSGAQAAHRDNNMQAAATHVLADAAVSVMVIVGLVLGRRLGWTWMDPIAGLCGAVVTLAWSYSLVRNTGAILLDLNPDQAMSERMRALVETDGDRLTDLHLWRLGPGHLGAILTVMTRKERGPEFYHSQLRPFRTLSHVTVQVQRL